MNLVHEFGAWWFFADTHFSPAAIFGAVCLGVWSHAGYKRCRRAGPGMKGKPDVTPHYTYHVGWSAEDQEYVATVAEFPSLSWLAPLPGDALSGLVDLIEDLP